MLTASDLIKNQMKRDEKRKDSQGFGRTIPALGSATILANLVCWKISCIFFIIGGELEIDHMRNRFVSR